MSSCNLPVCCTQATKDVNPNNRICGVSLGPCKAVGSPKGRPHRELNLFFTSFKFLRFEKMLILAVTKSLIIDFDTYSIIYILSGTLTPNNPMDILMILATCIDNAILNFI